MKHLSKIATLVAIVFICANTVTAQTWKTTGNNIGSTDFLGSTNNQALNLKTNDTTRLQIGKTGTTTINSLKVTGNALFTGPVTFADSTGDAIIPIPNVPSPGLIHDDMIFQTGRACIINGSVLVVRGRQIVLPTALNAMGINTETPNYMLDVLCNPPNGVNKQDINVSTTAATQNVGYRIGGNMVLWHNGDITSIYAGVKAGGGVGSGGLVNNNTFVGYEAGTKTSSGGSNVFVGSQAGLFNTTGNTDVFVGGSAGQTNTTGGSNTFSGWNSGFSNTTGDYNTFTGANAGYHNIGGAGLSGSYNTFTGEACGYSNTLGDHNQFYGKKCGYSELDGMENCYYGSHTAYEGVHNDSNSYFGSYAGYNEQGNENVMMGMLSGGFGGTASSPFTSYLNVFIGSRSASTNTGNYNIVIGAEADAVGAITNAGALGASAIAKNKNQFILGNNLQFFGIGLSNDPTGPMANLEICTHYNTSPPKNPTFIGNGTYLLSNSYGGTGFSGLKFTDLTSQSTVCNPTAMRIPPTGVLSVDEYGNVIYVPIPVVSVASTCANPIPLNGDGVVHMNKHNFYFDDYNVVKGENDVIVGEPCGYVPQAKLDVENSTEYVAVAAINSRVATGTNNYGLNGQAFGSSIGNWGVWGQATGKSGENFGVEGTASDAGQNEGGYFVASGPAGSTNYGINTTAGFVGSGGAFNYGVCTVAANGSSQNYGVHATAYGPSNTTNYGIYSHAYSTGTPSTNWSGYFLGPTYCSGGVWASSDSMLKTNLQLIGNSQSLLNGLKMYSFSYDTATYSSMELPSGTHYGFLAQNVGKIFPGLVKTAVQPQVTDSAGNVITPAITFQTVNYTEFIPVVIGAVQQQELSIDSLRNNQHTGGGWSLTGNAGTIDGTDFIGTTDNVPFSIRVNNMPAARIDPTLNNTYIGYKAGNITTPGSNNFATGYSSLASNTTGGNNFAIGFSSLTSNTTGYGNIALGYSAMTANLTGIYNIGIGYNALANNDVDGNTAIGYTALQNNNLGYVNSAVGYDALSFSNANYNTAMGAYAGYQTTSGAYNTGCGGHALLTNTTGSNNTALGYGADVGSGNLTNATAIGYEARVDASNSIVLGGTAGYAVNVGIGTATPGYALQVEANGNSTAAYFDGDVYTTGSYLPSDRTLKTNIDSISNCKSMLCKLKPRSFNYDSASHPSLNLPGGTQYGLIAQDVQSVLPNLVRTVVRPALKDTSGNIVQPAVTFMGLNYTQLIPLLVKGYQDQQQTIDSLRNTLNNIQSCINSLCDSSRRHTKVSNTGSDNPDNVQNVTLTSANAAILYQNTPNPFSTGTKINYFLPEGTMGASMIFFDMYGNKLKEVALQQTGMGTLNITPDNMKDGVYSYSLVINGQLVDTKKMVLQK